MKRLVEVDAPPTNGTQFIITWEFGDQFWSSIMRYKNNRFQEYDNEEGCWRDDDGSLALSNKQYFVPMEGQ